MAKRPPVVSFITGVVIFACLPVVAWGPSDLRGFTAHPVRLAYLVVTVVLQLVAIILVPGIGSSHGPGVRSVPRQRIAVVMLQLVSLALILLAPFCDRRGFAVMWDRAALRGFGLALYTYGMLLMLWAEQALGRLFSVEVAIQADHRLVTSGPFRFVRHPRYAGMIYFATGFSLVFRSWLGFVLVAMLKLVLLWRIRAEEALLREQFGSEWDAYARRTRRLLPYVY